jgi:hypothetical protein
MSIRALIHVQNSSVFLQTKTMPVICTALNAARMVAYHSHTIAGFAAKVIMYVGLHQAWHVPGIPSGCHRLTCMELQHCWKLRASMHIPCFGLPNVGPFYSTASCLARSAAAAVRRSYCNESSSTL